LTHILSSATARGLVLGFLLTLVISLVGLTSPAAAASSESGAVVISLQTEDRAATDRCPSTGDAGDMFGVDGHCSVDCGPHDGASAFQAVVSRIGAPAERSFAVSNPWRPRTDTPEPFPPRIPDNA